tara:strand:+ start:1386 stop:1682 length:297 start_codon:yes stop_codon:yes gene_type:complete
MSDLNVDVICNDTGEILKEGLLFESAQSYIAKRDGKVVRDEVDVIILDDIDGGGQMEVRNLWVEIPEIQEDIRKEEENAKRTRAFWNNWQNQRKQIIW